MQKPAFLLLLPILLLVSISARAACDCGANQCSGTSVTYEAPSWSVDQRDIRFQFSCNGGSCTCGQYVNGDYWVVDNGLVISRITPDHTSGCESGSDCRHGSR